MKILTTSKPKSISQRQINSRKKLMKIDTKLDDVIDLTTGISDDD
jgi:hypothetical protein